MPEREASTPEPALTPPAEAVLAQPIRWVWIGVGFFFVALGFIGAFLPVMPSTVFFIIAAYCFARGSRRWLEWLLALPKVGPLVRDYRAGKGMPLRAKRIAASMCSVAVLLSSVAVESWAARALALALGVAGVWFILFRVPTRENHKP
ncbi:Inner membrane protein YbaN [Calidithermus terrae]|uniref:Inner membrane protein YbaN n=1 Tax=Calidithermus terrae TaxID=1408545 RepID=A0A399F474_9DEIN|nr:YbaN family protein [Calidithermus terrae]RIH90585.1 Inner membrane protein YbaN [Calidithermus terrae]